MFGESGEIEAMENEASDGAWKPWEPLDSEPLGFAAVFSIVATRVMDAAATAAAVAAVCLLALFGL